MIDLSFDGSQVLGILVLSFISVGLPAFYYGKCKAFFPASAPDIAVVQPAPLKDIVFSPEPTAFIETSRYYTPEKFQLVIESISYNKDKRLKLNLFITNLGENTTKINYFYIWYLTTDGKETINWDLRYSTELKPNECANPEFLSKKSIYTKPLSHPLGKMFFSLDGEKVDAELNLSEYFI